MRKTLFYAPALIFLASLSAWPGGFESAGLGARATSMGGAFIGVADDWTAIYWNPAGLAHLKGKGVGAALEYVRVQTHDSQGLVNAQIPFTQTNDARGDVFSQFGGEPTTFQGNDSDFKAPLPGLGFYWASHGITVAGGSYTPLGFAFNVTDAHDPGYNVSYKSQGTIINHNLSLATTLFQGFTIGAGVNLVQASLYRTSDKVAPTYEASASAESKTLALQGVFGALLDLGSKAHLGGVYRTGQNLSLKGHASIDDQRFPAEASDFTQVIRNPTTYGIGLSVVAWPSLTLAMDWQHTQWSATRTNIQFDQENLILKNQAFDPGWSSTSRYRFGAEWRPLASWSFRGGYFTDPRAVAYSAQGLTGIIDPRLHYFTSGVSFHRSRWQLSLTNQIGSGKEVVAGRTLKKEVNSFVTEVDYYL